VGRGTIANVLRREGIEAALGRGGRTSWSAFLKAHWHSIVAAKYDLSGGDLLCAFRH